MIHIIDNFYLDADDRQFILIEWDGKTSTYKGSTKNEYKSQMFYSRFENVLEKLAVILQRRAIGEVKTLQELGQKLDETKKLIESIGTRMWPDFEDASSSVLEPDKGIPYDLDT